jgi:uncharacterized protein (DUF1778 family)
MTTPTKTPSANSVKAIRGRENQKEARLSIRASEPEKTILEQAARLRHMNTSQFVLQVSLDAAQVILVDQTQFKLPADQWAAFCTRLDEPAKAIPQLQELFSSPEPYDAA